MMNILSCTFSSYGIASGEVSVELFLIFLLFILFMVSKSSLHTLERSLCQALCFVKMFSKSGEKGLSFSCKYCLNGKAFNFHED